MIWLADQRRRARDAPPWLHLFFIFIQFVGLAKIIGWHPHRSVGVLPPPPSGKSCIRHRINSISKNTSFCSNFDVVLQRVDQKYETRPIIWWAKLLRKLSLWNFLTWSINIHNFINSTYGNILAVRIHSVRERSRYMCAQSRCSCTHTVLPVVYTPHWMNPSSRTHTLQESNAKQCVQLSSSTHNGFN